MKILIIRLGRIGDMILSTPLLSQLKVAFPTAEIDVLASNDNHKILMYADYVDNVYIWDKNPIKLILLLMKLRKKNYNFILEPKDHYSTESYYIAGLVKADKRIGFVKEETSIFDVDISKFNAEKIHFQDRVLSTIKAFEIVPDYNINVPLNYPDYILDSQAGRASYIVLNISASRETKCIPFEIAKVIIEHLKSKNIKTILIASPSDSEIADKLANITQIERVKTTSITDTFPLIHKAMGLISADTSLVHIAGTYDTPVMVLSKSIDAELQKFAPKSKINLVIKSESSEKIQIEKSKLQSKLDHFLQIIED